MVKETSPDSCWFHHPHPRKNNSQPTADKECIKTSFFLHVTFCQEAFPAEAPATSDTSSPFDEPLPPQTRLCSLGHLPQPPWAALREAGQPRLQDGQKGAQTPGAAVLDTPLPLDGRASCKPPNRRDPLRLYSLFFGGSRPGTQNPGPPTTHPGLLLLGARAWAPSPSPEDGMKECKPARTMPYGPGSVLLPPSRDGGMGLWSQCKARAAAQKPLPQFSPGATHFSQANFKPFLKRLLSGQTSPGAPSNNKLSAQSFLLRAGVG